MATNIIGFRHRHLFPRLIHFDRPGTQVVAALVIGWVPLVLLGLLARVVTGRPEPTLADASVHVRLLVAVPLFLVSELTLALQARQTLARLANEGFVADGERARFDRIVHRAEHWRRAFLPEAMLLVGALAIGVATLAGWRNTVGAAHGTSPSELGAARIWFDVVGLPLFLFLFGRSLWHWAIWVYTLLSLAWLPLRLVPSHPDRRGGIGFLTLPSLAFHAPFQVAVGGVLCASWGMQIASGGGTMRQFAAPLLVFAAIGELVAFAPLLAFTPRLFLAARAGVVQYGALGTDYARRFFRRWLAPGAPRDELLGTGDLQSMNDLGANFRDVVEKTSPLVFRPRDLIAVLAAMALPVVALGFAVLPLEAVLKKLLGLLVGSH